MIQTNMKLNVWPRETWEGGFNTYIGESLGTKIIPKYLFFFLKHQYLPHTAL